MSPQDFGSVMTNTWKELKTCAKKFKIQIFKEGVTEILMLNVSSSQKSIPDVREKIIETMSS